MPPKLEIYMSRGKLTDWMLHDRLNNGVCLSLHWLSGSNTS